MHCTYHAPFGQERELFYDLDAKTSVKASVRSRHPNKSKLTLNHHVS